jgi:phenylalanyl-tRNA synthetase alpha chain
MESELLGSLQSIKNDATGLILSSESLSELNEIKLDFLGKSGRLSTAIKELSKIPAERRSEIGKLANEVKTTVEELISEQEKKLNSKESSPTASSVDVTLPGIRPPEGHLHLITQAIEEISSIFEHIGFQRVRYPEVEWDWYAFEGLNFPENHPARDDWETFFIESLPHEKKAECF